MMQRGGDGAAGRPASEAGARYNRGWQRHRAPEGTCAQTKYFLFFLKLSYLCLLDLIGVA